MCFDRKDLYDLKRCYANFIFISQILALRFLMLADFPFRNGQQIRNTHICILTYIDKQIQALASYVCHSVLSFCILDFRARYATKYIVNA